LDGFVAQHIFILKELPEKVAARIGTKVEAKNLGMAGNSEW
jgi:hypothetical protein